MLDGATGSGCQFRLRSFLSPWKSPQSTRTRFPSSWMRNFDPVTVRAAPRKVMSTSLLYSPFARLMSSSRKRRHTVSAS